MSNYTSHTKNQKPKAWHEGLIVSKKMNSCEFENPYLDGSIESMEWQEGFDAGSIEREEAS